MPHYRVNVGTHNQVFTDFNEAVAAKGLDAKQVIGNLMRRHSFSNRSGVDRPKDFKGLYAYGYIEDVRVSLKPLKELAAANDIQSYVEVWRKINHLTN